MEKIFRIFYFLHRGPFGQDSFFFLSSILQISYHIQYPSGLQELFFARTIYLQYHPLNCYGQR